MRYVEFVFWYNIFAKLSEVSGKAYLGKFGD